jgi:ABC-2 type transport system permease protein
MTNYTGTAGQTRLRLRTGWAGLLGLVVGGAVPVIATAASVADLYPDDAHRAVYAQTIGTSVANTAFNGRGYDLTRLGGITVFESGIFTQLVLPVLTMILVVRHTRAEEDSGRTELVTARRVGRLAPPAGAAVAVGVAMLLTGAAVAVGVTATGLPWRGSVLYGVSLIAMMCLFGALGLICAQVGATARSAQSLALALFAAAYLPRVVIDGRGLSLPWISPLGWVAEVRPYGSHRMLPVVAYLAAAVALTAAAAWLAVHRDLGAGVLKERRGAVGSTIRTPFALEWRLSRGAFAGWAAASVAWGAVFGGISSEMARVITENPTVAEALGIKPGHAGDVITAYGGVFIALLGAAAGIAAVARGAGEETSARFGLITSTRISRRRARCSALAVAAVQSSAAVLLGGLALGLAGWASTGSRGQVGSGLSAATAPLPGVLLLIGAAALAAGMSPRAMWIGWVFFGWALVVAILADTLQLPGWSRDLSPLDHAGRVPLEPFHTGSGVVLVVLAVGLIAAAVTAGTRRDLVAG